MVIRVKKPPLLASIFAIMAFGVLIWLGNWQAQKYVTKSKIIGDEYCVKVAPEPISHDFTNIRAHIIPGCPHQFVLEGQLQTQTQIPIGPRLHDGVMGYHVYIPLLGNDNSYILLNMGWSERSEIIDMAGVDSKLTQRPIQVSGNLIEPSRPHRLTPENKPSLNQWFSLQTEEVRAHIPYLNENNLAKDVLFVQSSPSEEILKDFIPAAMAKSFLSPQTHMQYAAFWFSMAAALIVIYVLRFILIIKN